jgi:L-glutamine-phosphate cytidylyltransferase
MQAVILAAGRGLRLMPHTRKTPKCLLEVGDGRSILEHQLSAIETVGGVDKVVLVLGHRATTVEGSLARISRRVPVEVVFNPLFKESDSLFSLWLAMHRQGPEFLVMNGDTVFKPDSLSQLLDAPSSDVHLLVSRPDQIRDDAVKVVTSDGWLLNLGKEIETESANGESMGILRLLSGGARDAALLIDRMLRMPGGHRLQWNRLLRVMVDEGRPVSVGERPVTDWFEIDRIADLELTRREIGEAASEGSAWPREESA